MVTGLFDVGDVFDRHAAQGALRGVGGLLHHDASSIEHRA
jgi:hypothetical protein